MADHPLLTPEHIADLQRRLGRVVASPSGVGLSAAEADLLNALHDLHLLRGIAELAEDCTRALLENDGPCALCHAVEEDDEEHAEDCQLDGLYHRARAALGRTP